MNQTTNKLKLTRRLQRKARTGGSVRGTAERPRLSIFRSVKNIYAQVIDDTNGRTIVSASSMAKDVKAQRKHGGNKDAAVEIGKTVAQRAIEKGITQVSFDRNGYRYHGRVKALADAAREAGLKF